MTTREAQVITDVRACRCLDASERTSASVSLAVASILSVILPPSHVANRVSNAAPVSSRTISSPLLRAHRPMSGRAVTLKDIACHHGRTAAGKYSHQALHERKQEPQFSLGEGRRLDAGAWRAAENPDA